MIERKFDGKSPRITLPAGAIDTQTHMYLPGYEAAEGCVPLPEKIPGPDEYRRVMDWLGIERVVITQGNAHGFDNTNLLACVAQMGAAARGVAAIAADTSDRELQVLHEGGICGARIMDLPGGAIGLEGLEAIDERATTLGWMIAVQFDGSHILDHAPRLAKLKSRYVVDHHGKFFAGTKPGSKEISALKQLIDGGRCWFKFAGCYESSKSGGPEYDDIAAVARDIGSHAPERIVWGTNWPHNMAKTTKDYPDDGALLDTVLGWLPDDDAVRRAVVDNPEELYGFGRVSSRGA